MSTPQRAPLSTESHELRPILKSLLPILQARPDWYVSVAFEKKMSRNYSANLQQTQIQLTPQQGVILRIYDGFTLHEQATDQLDTQTLEATAQAFASRISRLPTPPTRRIPYRGASWEERLKASLDEEILCQIPPNVSAEVPVHFGIRFERDPLSVSGEAILKELQDLVQRCVSLAPQVGLTQGELNYIICRRQISVEESLFIDRDVDLSQTLYRQSLTLVTVSKGERAFLREGGLGGLEAAVLEEGALLGVLRTLTEILRAEPLVPGRYRLLMSPTIAGVLAHEAFGHAQEGDTCARGRSKAWDLHHSNEKVGNSLATILNNPAIYEVGRHSYGAWGSFFFDDEGWLAQKQVILQEGRLLAPMANLTSALRLGVPRTANGRRESWSHGIYTRQTNTYFSPGKSTLQELMNEVKDGFLATHPAGGMEDPKGMGIQVGIQFLKEIKDGKLTGRTLKGPAGGDIQLTGYTPDVLRSILGKSKIEEEHDGPDVAKHPLNDVGGCGKYHKEFVYAGCGGTYLLVDSVLLG